MKKINLESKNLNSLAYAEIKGRIISREFLPGQRLVDSQLCETFGISRTPIRDAMRMLTEDGLLVNNSARGFYVFRPTNKDIDEIFEISEMIEITSAKKIIHILSQREYQSMESKLAILEEKANNTASIDEDEEFKRYLIELSDNQRLYDVYLKNLTQRQLLANIIFFDCPESQDFKARKERSRMVHNKIIFAIRHRDEPLVREAIAEHTHIGILDAKAYLKQLNEQEITRMYEDISVDIALL